MSIAMEENFNSCSSNDHLQAQNWLKCFKDLFNQLAINDYDGQNRSNGSASKRRIPECKVDFLEYLQRFEKQLGSRESLTIRYLLDINFLQLHYSVDPSLEQNDIENKAAVAQMRDRLNEIHPHKTEEKLIDSVKELLADYIFVWGTQAVIEILKYNKTCDLAELERFSVDDLEILISVTTCLGSWAKYMGGYQINKCQNICEILVQIIEKCYWPCVKREDGRMFDTERRVAKSVGKTLKYIVIQKESQNYPKSAFTIIKMLFDSLSQITDAECKEENKNEGIIADIYKLIASVCDHHVGLILIGITKTNPEYAEFSKLLITEILRGTNKMSIYSEDESCSKAILHFWLILARKVNYDLKFEEKKKCIREMKALYNELAYILLEKAQYPNENVAETVVDQNLKGLRDYRMLLQIPLLAFHDILKNDLLQILSDFLDKGIAKFKSNPMSWNKLEMGIFGFGTIAESVDKLELNRVSKLMGILTEIPYEDENDKLLKMIFSTVASLRYWFCTYPSYIPFAVQILVKGLKSSVASSADWGVAELTSDCGVLFKPFAKLLLDTYNESLSSGKIRLYDSDYRAIGTLISMLPAEKIPKYLDIFANFYFEKLRMICQDGEKNPEANNTTILGLKKILYLFNSINAYVSINGGKQEVDISLQSVFLQCQGAMPVFRQVTDFWKGDQFVIEGVFLVFCGVFKALKMNFKPMLEDFCYFFISVYQKEPFYMGLFISRECLQVFILDEGSKQIIQQLFSQIVFYTLKFLEETPENEFSKVNDMTIQFLNFMMHLIENRFEFLLKINVDYSKLISYALKVLALSDCSEVEETSRFLGILILKSQNQPNMMKAVLDHGEAIAQTVILSIGCRTTAREDVKYFADLLHALKYGYLAELKNCMKMLDTPDFPTPLISKEDKRKFAAQIIKPNSDKYHIRMHARIFAANCRGVEQV